MLTANQNPALSLLASSTGGEPHMEIVDDANSENCEKKEEKCNSTNGTDTTLSIKGMPSSSSNRQVNRSPNVIIGLDRISSLISTLPNQCSIDFGDYFSVKAHIVNTQIENNYCSQMNEDSTTLIIDCDPEADGTNDPHRMVNVSFSTNDSDHKKVCLFRQQSNRDRGRRG